MQQRIDWIDAVKGSCLLLVIISHLWLPCPRLVAFLTAGYMQVFFVMSGMTNSPSNCSFREEVARKGKRLLFPYLFYGITLLLLGVLLPKDVVFERGLLGLLYGRYSFVSPTTGPETELLRSCVYLAPLWFLPCMFIACMLLWWYDHSRKPVLVILTAIAGGLLPRYFLFYCHGAWT